MKDAKRPHRAPHGSRDASEKSGAHNQCDGIPSGYRSWRLTARAESRRFPVALQIPQPPGSSSATRARRATAMLASAPMLAAAFFPDGAMWLTRRSRSECKSISACGVSSKRNLECEKRLASVQRSEKAGRQAVGHVGIETDENLAWQLEVEVDVSAGERIVIREFSQCLRTRFVWCSSSSRCSSARLRSATTPQPTTLPLTRGFVPAKAFFSGRRRRR